MEVVGGRRETDLHSAFDQIEGHDGRVRGATAENATKPTQDQILLRAELTTVPLWRDKGHTGSDTRTSFIWKVSDLQTPGVTCKQLQPITTPYSNIHAG